MKKSFQVNNLINLKLVNGKITPIDIFSIDKETNEYISKNTIALFLDVHINDISLNYGLLKTDEDWDLILPQEKDKDFILEWIEDIQNCLMESFKIGNKNYKENDTFVEKFNEIN